MSCREPEILGPAIDSAACGFIKRIWADRSFAFTLFFLYEIKMMRHLLQKYGDAQDPACQMMWMPWEAGILQTGGIVQVTHNTQI